jgi:hypothetical protein
MFQYLKNCEYKFLFSELFYWNQRHHKNHFEKMGKTICRKSYSENLGEMSDSSNSVATKSTRLSSLRNRNDGKRKNEKNTTHIFSNINLLAEYLTLIGKKIAPILTTRRNQTLTPSTSSPISNTTLTIPSPLYLMLPPTCSPIRSLPYLTYYTTPSPTQPH